MLSRADDCAAFDGGRKRPKLFQRCISHVIAPFHLERASVSLNIPFIGWNTSLIDFTFRR